MKRIRPERIYLLFLKLTKRLNDRQMLMLLAVIVGALAGVGTSSRFCSTPSRTD